MFDENKLEDVNFLEAVLSDAIPEIPTLTPHEKEIVKRILIKFYGINNPIQTQGEEAEEG